MAAATIDFNQWRDRLREKLPPQVLAFFDGGSRRELLKQVDCTVLVFNDRLVNLSTGTAASLPGVAAGNEAASLDASLLAGACASVIGDKADLSVLLLLPPGEFVATTVKFPGMSREALISALRLQADVLLPSLDQKLAVSVNPSASSGNAQHVALWITEARLDSLYDAFSEAGIFLTSVMPRNLLLLPGTGVAKLQESDVHSITRVSGENGCLTEWLHIDRADLEQELFLRQWERIQQQDTGQEPVTQNDESAYLKADFASAVKEYCFFPRGALNAERKMEKGKRLVAAGVAALVLLFLGASPFLYQSFEFRRLTSALESARVFSAGPRADRTVVQEFEDVWGPINDFPEQNVRSALFTLQNILSPDRLSSIEVTEGLIKIEGESAEPQAILQRLEQDPMFTEVAFSRATSNSRYYIDLRLSEVNFEGYMVRYFPDK